MLIPTNVVGFSLNGIAERRFFDSASLRGINFFWAFRARLLWTEDFEFRFFLVKRPIHLPQAVDSLPMSQHHQYLSLEQEDFLQWWTPFAVDTRIVLILFISLLWLIRPSSANQSRQSRLSTMITDHLLHYSFWPFLALKNKITVKRLSF